MNASTGDEPYLIVSADTHAGPRLIDDLRPYCPSAYLDDFDRFCAVVEGMKQGAASASAGATEGTTGKTGEHEARARLGQKLHATALALEALARTRACGGQSDPHARLADMNADGVAADVIFAGGQNGEVLPFAEYAMGSFPADASAQLRVLGNAIWNRWLADFVSHESHRHVGVMEVSLWDVPTAITEVEDGRRAGLKAVNLPAPRAHLPAYNEDVYEPFFAACEALEMPLLTHVGGGEPPLGARGSGGYAISMYETQWLSRRAVWQLILGGVFERHPGLKFAIAECRVGWVAETLNDLDSYCHSDLVPALAELSRLPSEYWATNCYNCGSFLAPFEVARRQEVGVGNLLWGSDYPHAEGTWPRTRLSLRNTFAGVPVEHVRRIVGANAIKVFSLDETALRRVADRIGPSPAELSTPLGVGENPELLGYAFRQHGAFA